MALHLETHVPYGNACDIEIDESSAGAEIAFAADPHGGPECLWFCFRVRFDGDGAAPQGLRLTLKHAENMLGGNNPATMRPVVRYDGEDWKRLGAGAPRERPDGRMLVTWELTDPLVSHLDVAYCYPYGWPQLDELLEACGGAWNADTVGVSQGARPMVRLSNDPGEPDGRRAGLYLMCRQHAAETSGSWVMDGFMRHIAELGATAPLVWAIPLSNIDAVEHGDYGKDNFPYDLNRAWGQPPMRHETLVIQRDMRRWVRRCRPILTLDFHAPGACESGGIYTFLPDPEKTPAQYNAVTPWVAAMREALGGEYASENFARVARYHSRWSTPRFTDFSRSLGVDSITFEIPYAICGSTVMTREHYREAGRRLARAVTERLK